MLRGWPAAYARALTSFRTIRAQSGSASTRTSKTTQPLPYAAKQKPQHQATAATTKQQQQQRQDQQSSSPRQTNSSDNHFVRWFFITVNLFIAGHLTTTYIFSLNTCLGPSMLPTINYKGDWVILSKIHASMGWIQVGDLVSFKHPVRQGHKAIKRVIGMPGDFVLRDTPGKGDGTMVRVPQGHCWVVGDNMDGSRDSRMFGALPLALVRAKVVARVWPEPRLFNDGLTDFNDADDDKD